MSSFRIPEGYISPPWPSLCTDLLAPNFKLSQDPEHSLYHLSDIWWFTMLWCFIFSIAVYLPAGFWALYTLARSHTLKWYILPIIPLIFVVGGCIGAAFGSITGIGIAYIYNSGSFVTSTWIPFLWSLIHILTMMIGSLSTVTAIL